MRPKTISIVQALASIEHSIESKPENLQASVHSTNEAHKWWQSALYVVGVLLGKDSDIFKKLAKASFDTTVVPSPDRDQFVAARANDVVAILGEAKAAVAQWEELPKLPTPINPNAAVRAVFDVLATMYMSDGNANHFVEWKDPLWEEMGMTQKEARMAFQDLRGTPLVKDHGIGGLRLTEDGCRDARRSAIIERLFPLPTTTEHTAMPQENQNPTKIFISHNAADAELAKKLVSLLKLGLAVEGKQIRCTSVHGHKLEGGDDTPGTLRDDLRACSVVLCAITPASVDSDWVLLELGAAWALGKRSIPIVAHGATFKVLPPVFGLTNALQGKDSAEMTDMIDTIATHAKLEKKNRGAEFQEALGELVHVAGVEKQTKNADVNNTPQPAALPTSMPDDDILALLRDQLEIKANSPLDRGSIAFVDFDRRAGVPAGSTQRLIRHAVVGTIYSLTELTTTRFRLIAGAEMMTERDPY